MIKSITIYKKEPVFFEANGKINKGEEKTDITVKKISVLFSRVKIKFSDGEVLIFKGFPISIVK